MTKDEYLITDPPLKALTVFAMPMILGSFFQQVYNMADSIIVGQFVGSSALAAVGACAALTNVFICIALGAGVGAGVAGGVAGKTAAGVFLSGVARFGGAEAAGILSFGAGFFGVFGITAAGFTAVPSGEGGLAEVVA